MGPNLLTTLMLQKQSENIGKSQASSKLSTFPAWKARKDSTNGWFNLPDSTDKIFLSCKKVYEA
jgi:hypothetical protein